MTFPDWTPVGHFSMFQWSITWIYVPGCSQERSECQAQHSFVSCTEKAQQPRLVRLAEAAVHYAVWKAVLHQCQRTGLDEPTGLCFYLQKQFSNLVFCFRITCFFSKLMPSCPIWKAMALKHLRCNLQKHSRPHSKNWRKNKNCLSCSHYCFSDRKHGAVEDSDSLVSLCQTDVIQRGGKKPEQQD